jgi:hypothetical protein
VGAGPADLFDQGSVPLGQTPAAIAVENGAVWVTVTTMLIRVDPSDDTRRRRSGRPAHRRDGVDDGEIWMTLD